MSQRHETYGMLRITLLLLLSCALSVSMLAQEDDDTGITLDKETPLGNERKLEDTVQIRGTFSNISQGFPSGLGNWLHPGFTGAQGPGGYTHVIGRTSALVYDSANVAYVCFDIKQTSIYVGGEIRATAVTPDQGAGDDDALNDVISDPVTIDTITGTNTGYNHVFAKYDSNIDRIALMFVRREQINLQPIVYQNNVYVWLIQVTVAADGKVTLTTGTNINGDNLPTKITPNVINAAGGFGGGSGLDNFNAYFCRIGTGQIGANAFSTYLASYDRLTGGVDPLQALDTDGVATRAFYARADGALHLTSDFNPNNSLNSAEVQTTTVLIETYPNNADKPFYNNTEDGLYRMTNGGIACSSLNGSVAFSYSVTTFIPDLGLDSFLERTVGGREGMFATFNRVQIRSTTNLNTKVAEITLTDLIEEISGNFQTEVDQIVTERTPPYAVATEDESVFAFSWSEQRKPIDVSLVEDQLEGDDDDDDSGIILQPFTTFVSFIDPVDGEENARILVEHDLKKDNFDPVLMSINSNTVSLVSQLRVMQGRDGYINARLFEFDALVAKLENLGATTEVAEFSTPDADVESFGDTPGFSGENDDEPPDKAQLTAHRYHFAPTINTAGSILAMCYMRWQWVTQPGIHVDPGTLPADDPNSELNPEKHQKWFMKTSIDNIKSPQQETPSPSGDSSSLCFILTNIYNPQGMGIFSASVISAILLFVITLRRRSVS